MSSHVITDNHQVYHAHDADTLLSEVVASVCILLPKAFAVAGFGADGKVRVIKHNSYNHSQPEWDAAFFEYEFLNEPLLAIPAQLKAVYIAGDYTLAIPDELYDGDALSSWMHSMYHFPESHLLDTYSAPADNLHYAFSVPDDIHAIVHRYFADARLMPLAAYQLCRPRSRKDAYMQCFISGQHVTASLRLDGRLLWHQVFTYADPVDIAWQFTHVCKSHHIHGIDLNVEATVLSDHYYDLLLELETFFPKISWSERQMNNEGHWAPAIFLMQQLYACAL